MNKLLCILLLLLFLPIGTGAAANSPTLEHKLHNSEDIEIQLLDSKEAQQVYDTILESKEIVSIIGAIKPVEGFRMILDVKYETVAWYFLAPFSMRNRIIMILVGESTYLLEGTIEDNAVLFDFTDIEPGIYDVLVFYVK